jgi:ribosomal protein S17E
VVASAEEDKRIEHVRVDIELKSLVNRIKGMTTQMKDRVKKQKEISESIISERGDE